MDHEHETGRCRGTLCGYCNKAVGFFNDDPILLQKALAYLQRPIPEDAPMYKQFSTNFRRASRPLRKAALDKLAA
jgi:hypothetical protein